MTVRGGRGPREPAMPDWRASDGRGGPPGATRYRRGDERRRFRLPGPIRFVVFALVLAGIVLITLLTALRPIVRAGVVSWAWDNPTSITRFAFVADFVREDLGPALSTPAGTDASQTAFEVNPGDTIYTIAPRLVQSGYVTSEHVFLFAALEGGLPTQLQSGSFLLRRNMTPGEVVDALIRSKIDLATVPVTFREGLRLEQMTALLETIQSGVDPMAFYDLARHPTKALLADYPWLQLPAGASLEGFLYPATYTLITSTSGGPYHVTTAEDLVRMLLDKFYSAVGPDLVTVPAARHMTFYQIVTLASIVEREASLDSERPLIAGVYANRLNPKLWPTGLLGSDPTIFYVNDSLQLAKLTFASWPTYVFWDRLLNALPNAIPAALAGYDTYVHPGLPVGPICSPTVASIVAALNPNTGTGYLYFVAKGDGTTAFEKTLAQHNIDVQKYGK